MYRVMQAKQNKVRGTCIAFSNANNIYRNLLQTVQKASVCVSVFAVHTSSVTTMKTLGNA